MSYYISTTEGMGGLLNPPGHAEHTHCVIEKERGKEVGSMSLSYAVGPDTPHVPTEIKARAAALLAALPGTFTEEWENRVYAYFHNCYSPDGVTREVSKCVVVKGSTSRPDWHLAYLHIKSFFPDVKPNLELIANPPAWGKKESSHA